MVCTRQVLTPSHNPADPGERARILKSGGEVGVFPGEPSVAETGQGRVFVAGTGKILLFPHKRFCVYDLVTDAITY